jgi:RNA polymerase sigma-70 factor (ECF subfamily)
VWVPVSPEHQPAALDAEVIWQEFHERLLGFIARRVSDRTTAEDILQEVVIRIHRHAAEVTRAPAVGAWVHRIARNAIADHYRRAPVRRERPSGLALDGQELRPPDLAAAELRGELAACVRPLLERLPAIHRQALTLTELDGLTQAQAAARLGLSTSGMKSRVQRARVELRKLLTACCQVERDSRGNIINYTPDEACDCRAPIPVLPDV